ncbi:hypothetical protein D3C86_1809620 [compost metagenome]
MAAWIAPFSLLTMAPSVPAGPTKANQPGMAGACMPASFKVGTLGRSLARCSARIANGITLPASICGNAEPSTLVMTSTCPPITAFSAGPEPL